MTDRRDLLRKALLIRRVEETLLELFAQGKLSGTVHTCVGQEWVGVALAEALIDGDTLFSSHRGHGHFLARYPDRLAEFFAELMGKATGVCGGRGGSQHLHADGFFSNGVQGSLVPIGAGYALAMRLRAAGNIAAVCIGDGTLGEGIVYETLNIAARWALPLLVVLEDNGYAQSTPKSQTLAGTARARATAFGIEYRESNTRQWEQLLSDAQGAVRFVREARQPLLLEVQTYRLRPHSTSRDHRDPREVAEHEANDGLSLLVLDGGDATAVLLGEINDRIRQAVVEADLAPVASLDADQHRHMPPLSAQTCWVPMTFEKARIADILHDTLTRLFESNPALIMIGEDIEAPYGGAFKVTRDMSQRFPGRVRNTPICEAAITGIGTGLALAGYRPMVEIMFGDFLTLAFDQLVQSACKFAFMYDGQVRAPLIVRTPMGGKRGYGPTHSQCIEKHFLGVPGLTVVALNPRLSPAVLYERVLGHVEGPVLVIENKILYTRFLRTEIPAGFDVRFSDEAFPCVRITPVGARPDVTIVCYGEVLEDVEQALEHAFYEHEILGEVLCPSCLCPLNVGPVAESVRRTGRLLTVEEGSSICALSSEIVARLGELGVAVRRLRRLGYDSTVPASHPLEMSLLPDAGDVCRAMVELCRE